ncbi:Stress responsive A/B Barrel Domain protein [Photorhabdus australis subsp. thailandensis]|uniref:Stress responsive A/B Barrel Domain protein n=1 Tax=Photorhabdus australis subsp. thailandensis TaxID=2805096 RepID=A0A1C0U7M8_9GAMM|nr:Dabb family protein [Photorhabdus australis]OCQ53917.1 Stress responsive A/B Barrel Domain protein [Photorhabdus australis subsp. thailandensis]
MPGKNYLIAHQVFFTFKDGISWDSEKAILAERVALNHVNEISEIKGWFCGRNICDRSIINRKQSVDFSLIGYFKSHQDLDIYINHPDHVKGVVLWKEISTWTVSDIIIDINKLINFTQLIGKLYTLQ